MLTNWTTARCDLETPFSAVLGLIMRKPITFFFTQTGNKKAD